MNRIVIIGNGFDLAHGLPTRYEDFIVDYLCDALFGNSDYSDELIDVEISKSLRVVEPIQRSEFKSLTDIVSHPKIKFFYRKQVLNVGEGKKYGVKIKSILLSSLLHDQNWTNIEKTYFKLVLMIFPSKGGGKINVIEQLNKDFAFLKSKLYHYLVKIEESSQLRIKQNRILDILSGACLKKINSASHLFKMEIGVDELQAPEKVYFLNFNYTSILKSYLDLLTSDKRAKTEVLPIHGELIEEESIIFGYGDETHEDYKFLENQDEEELLTNIKSFYYPAKWHYQELMDLINSSVFDVYVIGHSLGLSDRVLLKTIFESDNCKAIKLFHRGSEQSQFKKRIALSRHFDDKIAMRSKVLNYSRHDVFGWDSIEY
jgi:hypothetical protein